MSIGIVKTQLQAILPLRTHFLQESNFQIRYDACHVRNWSDSYLLQMDGKAVGYGSVKGKEALADRDAVFEFYVIPAYRKWTSDFFAQLLAVSQASMIECQSNDLGLSALLYEFGHQIYADVILFSDNVDTNFQQPDLIFRRRRIGDDVFGKKEEDAGEYVLERSGEILADGGLLTHYNLPFADLYMEVKATYRRTGLGAYMLQEVKKQCRKAGRVPAARCNMTNKASKATLLKAGFQVCGFMLTGEVRRSAVG